MDKDSLRQRIEQLEQALRVYGQHLVICPRRSLSLRLTPEIGNTVHDPGPCTCGAEAILRGDK